VVGLDRRPLGMIVLTALAGSGPRCGRDACPPRRRSRPAGPAVRPRVRRASARARLRLRGRSGWAWRRRSPGPPAPSCRWRRSRSGPRGDLRVRAARLAGPRRGQPDAVGTCRCRSSSSARGRAAAVPSAAQNAAVTAALRAQPGTEHDVAVYAGRSRCPASRRTSTSRHSTRRRLDRRGHHRRALVRRAGEVDVNTVS